MTSYSHYCLSTTVVCQKLCRVPTVMMTLDPSALVLSYLCNIIDLAIVLVLYEILILKHAFVWATHAFTQIFDGCSWSLWVCILFRSTRRCTHRIILVVKEVDSFALRRHRHVVLTVDKSSLDHAPVITSSLSIWSRDITSAFRSSIATVHFVGYMRCFQD